MPNRKYEAGVRKERKKMKELREQGFEVMRTAGSHGVFDVIAIKDPHQYISNVGLIKVIQLKAGKTKDKVIKSIKDDIKQYSGIYLVEAIAE